MLNLPLKGSFRYVHEPLRASEDAIPVLGHHGLTGELKDRIAYSRGGTFLVTGFRGVGKTTLVLRALDEIHRARPEHETVVPVVLNVARPMTTVQLLFTVVRRLFETLQEEGVLDRLPDDLQQSLLTAYLRTSLTIKETRSDAAERTASVELNLPGLQLPKTTAANKRTRSSGSEHQLLPYTAEDVEHDVTRIVGRLAGGAGSAVEARRGPWWRPARQRPPSTVRLVVVLDELDKLTDATTGVAELEALLGGLKNVVSTGGAHYIVVAGPELQDRVVQDSVRGNGLYEGIFAWRLYVPCDWTASARLLEGVVPDSGFERDRLRLKLFERYLSFKARGVPRRLLNEFNSFVFWDEGVPRLRIEHKDWDRISFYAWLEGVIDEFFTQATQNRLFPIPIDRDRWFLGVRFLMDWILRNEGRQPFTAADIERAIEGDEIDRLLHIGRETIDGFLAHLEAKDVLTLVRDIGATSTIMADVSESRLPSYLLAESAGLRLLSIAELDETERAILDASRSPRPVVPGRPDIRYPQLQDRYELGALLGQGASSTVYAGVDLTLQRPVAIKILRPGYRENVMALGRFQREARLTAELDHPHVVHVHEVVARDADLAIVMELVEGQVLGERLKAGGRLPLPEMIQLAVDLSDTLVYLAGKGLARIDLKPSNIVMHPTRGPVIVDLGIARHVVESAENDMTRPGDWMIGTPAYMAPEQINGDRPDIRADLFSLGIVLYTCVNGRHPFAGLAKSEVYRRIVNEDLETSGLPVSAKLREVIALALVRDREGRFQHPVQMRDALLETPEWAGRLRQYDSYREAPEAEAMEGDRSWPPTYTRETPYANETPARPPGLSWQDGGEAEWTDLFGDGEKAQQNGHAVNGHSLNGHDALEVTRQDDDGDDQGQGAAGQKD